MKIVNAMKYSSTLIFGTQFVPWALDHIGIIKTICLILLSIIIFLFDVTLILSKKIRIYFFCFVNQSAFILSLLICPVFLIKGKMNLPKDWRNRWKLPSSNLFSTRCLIMPEIRHLGRSRLEITKKWRERATFFGRNLTLN